MDNQQPIRSQEFHSYLYELQQIPLYLETKHPKHAHVWALEIAQEPVFTSTLRFSARLY